jgi:D-alanyl-D-alanine carboxypeptidase/D-alanyl-D-alanine-endopeptidase (penicillin-binding protein 4)
MVDRPHVSRISIALLSVSLGMTIPAEAAQSEDCIAALDTALAQSRTTTRISPQADWGVAFTTLDRHVTYQQHGDRAFVPASNVKLFTTAAALLELGIEWRTETQVYWNRDRLILKGRGDPTLTRADLDDLAIQTLHNLSEDIKINHLVLDDGYFEGDLIDPHWEWEDTQAGYGAPVNATIVDRNAIPLTLIPQRMGESLKVVFERPGEAEHWIVENRSRSVSDTETEWLDVGRDWRNNTITVRGQLISGAPPEPIAVSIPDPAGYALSEFHQALSDRGLNIPETMINHAAFGIGTVVASHSSPPLSELVTITNQSSDNLFAETLLRQLGARSADTRGDTTTRDRGLQQVSEILQRELGLAPETYAMRDGSGLSRQNSIAPATFASLLQRMANSTVAVSFISSLPVLGESGTLASWSPLASGAIVKAKTGSMTGIYALSGYLVSAGQATQSPDTVAFSIIINHSDASYSDTQAAVARLLEPLDQFQRCRQSL